jgi:hypothetical protein
MKLSFGGPEHYGEALRSGHLGEARVAEIRASSWDGRRRGLRLLLLLELRRRLRLDGWHLRRRLGAACGLGFQLHALSRATARWRWSLAGGEQRSERLRAKASDAHCTKRALGKKAGRHGANIPVFHGDSCHRTDTENAP